MSGTAFLEVQMDVNISYGSGGGPGFKTLIFEGHTGLEQRSISWTRAKGKWNVAQGIRNQSDMDTIRKLFYNTSGRAAGFRFKDWGDYQLTNEQIATGDGTTLAFKIIKTYSVTGSSYVRRIFKPVSGTMVVADNATVRTEGAGAGKYTVDYTTGIITFDNAIKPANGHAITVSCDFDVPVRFDVDELSSSMDGYLTESWSNIPLVEILLEDSP
jgi:uncharacterized protein (TIGR02217 family)